MNELVSILLVGISLSMDTFSLSLSLACLVNNKNATFIPIVVGIFHFFMPLLGNFLGMKLVNIFNIASNVILGLILIFLAINLAIHYFKDEKININFNIWGILLFALSVSIDSFTVGLGISALSNKYIMSCFIFAMCSSLFTYMGFIIGKYSTKFIGSWATLFGIVLLLILGIIHLF